MIGNRFELFLGSNRVGVPRSIIEREGDFILVDNRPELLQLALLVVGDEERAGWVEELCWDGDFASE